MKLKRLFISVACFYFWPIIKVEPVLQLTLIQDEPVALSSVEKKIKKNGSLGRSMFNAMVHASPVSGFFAMYAGMLSLSDAIGNLVFPRRHTHQTVYVGITEEIVPVMRMQNTVHHWEFVKNKKVLFYKIEPTLNHDKNKLMWLIQEAEIPTNYIIPAEAVVLFCNPDSVHFDLNVFYEAYVAPHLFLPPLVVKKGTTAIKNSLHLLSIRHFFGPLQTIIKQQGKSYRMIVQS